MAGRKFHLAQGTVQRYTFEKLATLATAGLARADGSSIPPALSGQTPPWEPKRTMGLEMLAKQLTDTQSFYNSLNWATDYARKRTLPSQEEDEEEAHVTSVTYKHSVFTHHRKTLAHGQAHDSGRHGQAHDSGRRESFTDGHGRESVFRHPHAGEDEHRLSSSEDSSGGEELPPDGLPRKFNDPLRPRLQRRTQGLRLGKASQGCQGTSPTPNSNFELDKMRKRIVESEEIDAKKAHERDAVRSARREHPASWIAGAVGKQLPAIGSRSKQSSAYASVPPPKSARDSRPWKNGALERHHMQVNKLSAVLRYQSFESELSRGCQVPFSETLQNRQQDCDVEGEVPPVFHWEKTSGGSAAGTELVGYLQATVKVPAVPKNMHLYESLDANSQNGEKVVVDLAHQGLSDASVQMLIPLLLEHREHVSGFLLNSNNIVEGFRVFLDSFLKIKSSVWNVQQLDLSDNRLSSRSLHDLAYALRSRKMTLQSLNLSSIPILPDTAKYICQTIEFGPGMRYVNLANTECGRGRQDACEFAAKLCRKVLSLDLSHNFFRAEGMASLSEALVYGCVVQQLSLACNAYTGIAAAPMGDSEDAVEDPQGALMESIGENASLMQLDLSNCGLDHCAALCLEDALFAHPTLASLNVSDNPFGECGFRSMLRLVADKRTCLKELHCMGLRLGWKSPDVVFNPFDDDMFFTGSKALQLWRPHHRSLMRLLLDRADVIGLSPPTLAFEEFVLDGRKCSFVSERMSKLRKGVPRFAMPQGKIAEFHFRLPRLGPSSMCGSEEVVACHRFQRRAVGLIKFVSVANVWVQQRSEEAKTLFLSAVARDLHFKPSQLNWLAREVLLGIQSNDVDAHVRKGSQTRLMELLSFLTVTLDRIDRETVISVLHFKRIPPSGPDCVGKTCRARVLDRVRCLLNINFDNLTGHHRFDLTLPADYSAAHRFYLAARWETSVAAARKLLDLSQHGNYAGFRNVVYHEDLIDCKAGWSLPGDGLVGNGILEFDYTTPLRYVKRPEGPQLLSSAKFQELEDFVACWEGSKMTLESRIEALRAVSHRFALDASQLYQLLAALPSQCWRCEVYVMMFSRCTDFGAPLNSRNGGLLSDKELFPNLSDARHQLFTRLGVAQVFDPLGVHKTLWSKFRFDLQFHDDRTCMRYLVQLTALESGRLSQCVLSEPGIQHVEICGTKKKSSLIASHSKSKDKDEGGKKKGVLIAKNTAEDLPDLPVEATAVETSKKKRGKPANSNETSNLDDINDQAMSKWLSKADSAVRRATIRQQGDSARPSRRGVQKKDMFDFSETWLEEPPVPGAIEVSYIVEYPQVQMQKRQKLAATLLGWVALEVEH